MQRVMLVLSFLFSLLTDFISGEPLFGIGRSARAEIGSPIPAHYESLEDARNVWDMAVFDGVLYVATGDYNVNSGRTPIFAYDIKSGRWREPFITSDEALGGFRVINGKLFAIGNDSTVPGWEYGNYYELTDGGWVKHSDLPGAVHCFDIAELGGEYFISVGTEMGDESPVLRLGADGKYFPIDFIKDGRSVLSREELSYCRAYNLFALNGSLYAFFLAPSANGQPTRYEFYKYNGEDFEYLSSLGGTGVGFYRVITESGSKRLSQNFMEYSFERDGYIYFSTGAFYRTRDFLSFERIIPKDGAIVTDAVEHNGKYYVITFETEDDITYVNRVFELGDGDSATEVAGFVSKGSYALSLEAENGRFFVGMGNRARGEGVGEIYVIK